MTGRTGGGGPAGALVEALLTRRPTCGPVRVLALDGGAAAGKSQLADRLVRCCRARQRSVALVHTDDLLEGWRGQFTFWPRLRTAVLTPLAEGSPARVERYDWTAGRFAGPVEVPVADVLIVEGVSAIAACGAAATLRVLLDVPRHVRERRWVRRDGLPLQPEWELWLDNEDGFFAAYPPRADAVVRWPDQAVHWTPRGVLAAPG